MKHFPPKELAGLLQLRLLEAVAQPGGADSDRHALRRQSAGGAAGGHHLWHPGNLGRGLVSRRGGLDAGISLWNGRRHSVVQWLPFSFFLVAAPLFKMVFPKKGSLFFQGH